MIAVLGSVNMDIVTEVERLPLPGETVQGTSVRRFPGGKGANQAVAAARLGERVEFFGSVGNDDFGRELMEHFHRDRVDISRVRVHSSLPTGLACIFVEKSGENVIACTPGANAAVDEGYVDDVLDRLAAAEVVLVQFEIPMRTVAHLLRSLPVDRPLVIVDPAPPSDLADLPLSRVDILTPNRAEILTLAGDENGDVVAAARRLAKRGIRNVICKAGADGALWVGERTVRIPAPVVAPIDTTAAGDAFNGALACALASVPIEDAIRWANAAGALATTKRGAQPSLPDRKAVESMLNGECLH